MTTLHLRRTGPGSGANGTCFCPAVPGKRLEFIRGFATLHLEDKDAEAVLAWVPTVPLECELCEEPPEAPEVRNYDKLTTENIQQPPTRQDGPHVTFTEARAKGFSPKQLQELRTSGRVSTQLGEAGKVLYSARDLDGVKGEGNA